MSGRSRVAVLCLLLAACGGSTDSGGGGVTPPAPVSSIVVSATASSINVGATDQVTATLKDAAGNVLTGRTITWSSSNTAVATVDATGLVTALSEGTTTISAAAEGKAASVGITVLPVGPASISVAPTSASLAPGDTLQLVATVRDVGGNVLSGQTVTWTSSDTTTATVSSTGVVAVLGSSTTPHITAVSPAQLTLGATMTITGTGFGTVAGNERVTVAGGQVLVTAATATQITATIPASMPCTPTGPATVKVVNGLGSVTITAAVGTKTTTAALALGSHPDSTQQPVAVANQRTLAVGQAVLITDPSQVGCNELLGNASRYLVSVYNDVTSPSDIESFEVRGAGGVSVVASRATPNALAAAAAPGRRSAGAMLAPGVENGAVRHLYDGHAQRMQRTIEAMQPLIAELKSGGPPPRYNVAPGTPDRFVIPTTLGSTVVFKYPTGGGCTDFVSDTARVIYVGTHSIVLESNTAPLAGTLDTIFVSLAQKFDTLMYPILTSTFGNPMAFDDSLSKNGKVAMLFTKHVNDESANLLGFVSPCDMLPASYDAQAPASNNTEVFYARVPLSTTGSSGSVDVASVWKRIIGATLIHESKHITAVAERFADPVGTDLEQSWFEEGTAQVASEIYARKIYGVGWKSDATYANTVYCDLRGSGTTGPCAGAEYLMADQFTFLHDYENQNELTSFLSPGTSDPNIYGSAWLFARWLLDQYSASEGDLMKPLVADATMNGVENVTNKTGRSWDELDGYFTMMLAADNYPGFAQTPGARFEEPSWNLRDIFSGLHADDSRDFDAWPLGVRSFTFGGFVSTVPQLVGGSAALLDISGAQSAPQLLDIHSTSGSPLPPGSALRMVILRIQ